VEVLLLAGRAEDSTYEEEVELVGGAAGFVFEGLEGRGVEGAGENGGRDIGQSTKVIVADGAGAVSSS
jgi:hypothetical protein